MAIIKTGNKIFLREKQYTQSLKKITSTRRTSSAISLKDDNFSGSVIIRNAKGESVSQGNFLNGSLSFFQKTKQFSNTIARSVNSKTIAYSGDGCGEMEEVCLYEIICDCYVANGNCIGIGPDGCWYRETGICELQEFCPEPECEDAAACECEYYGISIQVNLRRKLGQAINFANAH